MKILAITLKNLNSLRGTWNINLEHNAYTSSGIFAVTGPTGAGKTTIFDAVCLALYATTPRLGKISSGSNEIMSKNTDSCMAKVKFESGGKIYVCEWMQERAKGKFQTKHTISSGGKMLNESTHLAETLTLVEKITGMDFKRFVQAVLLEQGGFDKFLNADKNDRAQVLELITGTETYSKLSSRVFSRNKNEHLALDAKRKELETEEARFAGMTEESLQSEISRKEEEISHAETEHESTGQLLTWHKDIARLNSELDGAMEDLRIHSRRAESFEAERAILESAERAVSLSGEYEALRAKRNAKTKIESDTSGLSAKILSQESECSQISGELPGLTDELSRLRGNISGSPEAVAAGIESAVRNYDAQKKARDDAEKALADAQRELAKAKSAEERAVSEGKSARAGMNEANERHSRVFDRIMSMRAKTASAVLDQERAKLEDGVPCPLCGSLTHPGIAHSDSGGENPDELFRQTESLEKELARAKSAVDSAQRIFDNAVTNWNRASANLSAADQKCRQCRDNLSAMRERLDECRIAVSNSIRPAGISWDDDTAKIMTQAREWSAKIDGLEKRIQSSQQRVSSIQAVIVSDRESLDAKRREFETLSAELDGLETSFAEKLRGNKFDGEDSFRQALSHSGEIEAMRKKREELSAQSAMLRGKLSDVQRRLDEKLSMKLTQESPETIEALHRNEEAKLRVLQQEKGVLTQKLANVRESAEKVKAIQAEYDALKVSADDWELLSSLIGSANGYKFRVYAQKVTLALVVNNANEYLRKMNGRYTLILTPGNDELELSVKDNEQAGQIRPTTNLSGGEKFIISLALALGLSQISDSKAQVDSLFIDEGFGSLDEEALNSALEALGEIRREGRMIGIISHISGISERIPTKINVIRKSEGKSIIEGPGCSGSI